MYIYIYIYNKESRRRTWSILPPHSSMLDAALGTPPAPDAAGSRLHFFTVCSVREFLFIRTLFFFVHFYVSHNQKLS